MLKKVLDYINQPTPSSFRETNITPQHPIATWVPKMEPMWKSVMLDYRDMALIALKSIPDLIRTRTQKRTKGIFQELETTSN